MSTNSNDLTKNLYLCPVCDEQCYPANSTIIGGHMHHNACLTDTPANKDRRRKEYKVPKGLVRLEFKADLSMSEWIESARSAEHLHTHILQSLSSKNKKGRGKTKIAICYHCKRPGIYEDMLVEGNTREILITAYKVIPGAAKAVPVHTFCDVTCDSRAALKLKRKLIGTGFEPVIDALEKLEERK